jgi:hypothetical protein
MPKMSIFAVLCALALATNAFAKTTRTKTAAEPPTVRQGTSLMNGCITAFVCRQDLFDRNNPNNARSNWPGPPAQPAQF